ncbi:hypothetical protein [Mesorhizobium sp. CN2-181]|uniref:hypothetical protein n=1 Tax=Mesorhizobium yinganensis TaxID=3157707 RepID=UPI0032B83A39
MLDQGDMADARQDFLEIISTSMSMPCYMTTQGILVEKLEIAALKRREAGYFTSNAVNRHLTWEGNGSGIQAETFGFGERICNAAGGLWASLRAWRMPAGSGSGASAA